MDDEILNDLLPDFIEEAEEHLLTVEADLLRIAEDAQDIDKDLVNKVFRGVHSIKGGAGFLGLDVIGELAHALENVLDAIRNDSLVPVEYIVDELLASSDSLRALIEDALSSNDVDVSVQVSRLHDILSEEVDVDSAESEVESTNEIEPPRNPPASAKKTKSSETTNGAEASAPRKSPQPESSVRVSVSTLDRLMNLAGELVLGRNRLVRVARNEGHVDLKEASHRISQVTSELQASVMETRMQPIGNVFSKFPRVVRDLCRKLGKDAELVLSGEDVDLDRSLIEAIGDPLTHLVRNSVDHGIEPPEDRAAAGKPTRGRIELAAFHQSGKVHIVIRDDGKGIDPSILRTAAVKKGVLTQSEAEALDDREALNLIFGAGFSTAKEVTDVSGRGVGMDVVRTNLEALSSTVEIESVVGEGSTITVKVPLTLAIMGAVIVRSEGQSYAIPQANVRELVAIRDTSQIEEGVDGKLLRLRGSLLALVRLDEIVGSHASEEVEASARTVVVVDTGNASFGICTDRHPDSEEIVVKPLGEHFKKVPTFGGGTILGDGSVALILDVNGIGSEMRLRLDGRGVEDSEQAENQGNREKLLLFSGGDAELFAIPVPVLSRIERVPADQVHEIGERLLWERPDRIMPLVRPHDVIHATPFGEVDRYMALVTAVDEKEVGILVPKLHDIIEPELEIDGELEEPGVFGSFQHDGKTVRLLDVALIAGVHLLDAEAETQAEVKFPAASVLYAEDSRFFREQTTCFLESKGLSVTPCSDGEIAWQVLDKGEREFAVVLTDIEMPNLGGLELTKRIKSDPRFEHIPVIALSSLNSERDLDRGLKSGLDDYQVKLDKKGLVGAFHRILKEAK